MSLSCHGLSPLPMGGLWNFIPRMAWVDHQFLLNRLFSLPVYLDKPFFPALNIHIDQYWLADPFNLRNHTLQIERFGQNDLEDFLHVDWCWRRTEYQRCMHCSCKPLCLMGGKPSGTEQAGPMCASHTCFVISSCSSRGNAANWSNFVPIRKGIAVYITGEYGIDECRGEQRKVSQSKRW